MIGKAQSTSFTTPGGPYTYTVPTGVYQVSVVLNGAQGGNGFYSTGGYGGKVSANLAVTPGETIYVYVCLLYTSPSPRDS